MAYPKRFQTRGSTGFWNPLKKGLNFLSTLFFQVLEQFWLRGKSLKISAWIWKSKIIRVTSLNNDCVQFTNIAQRHFPTLKLLLLYQAVTPTITFPPRPASFLPSVHEPRDNYHNQLSPIFPITRTLRPLKGPAGEACVPGRQSPMSFLVTGAHTPAAYHYQSIFISIHTNTLNLWLVWHFGQGSQWPLNDRENYL